MNFHDKFFYNIIGKTETHLAESQEDKRNPIAKKRIVKVQTIRGKNAKPKTKTFSQIRLQKNGFYDILQVSRSATDDELKRAYRKAVLITHPDKNLASADKDELKKRFEEIVAAYKILSDPNKRKIYNKYGLDGVKFQEENQCSTSAMWFMFSSAGRILSGIFLVTTCFFCCFCCFKCFCNCFCNCCCNHCCKDENMNENYTYNFSSFHTNNFPNNSFDNNESNFGHNSKIPDSNGCQIHIKNIPDSNNYSNVFI